MYHKEKVGDVEIMLPDKVMIEALQKVIEQNKLVLEMNQSIIRSIINPVMYYKEVESDLK